MAYIYGPVPSWRLGISAGIDLLSTQEKTCPFECIYCQLGKTIHKINERKKFISLTQLGAELVHFRNIKANYATFSGTGEPTLAINLGQAIKLVKRSLCLPVAVLTNSALITREDVREELLEADVVTLKLDAPDENTFQVINRPIAGLSLKEIIQGIDRFRTLYKGKLVLQMMFVEVNKYCALKMARIAKEIFPDEVQINTPLRPCSVKPLTSEEIIVIRNEFNDLKNVITVYEETKPEVTPLNLAETKKRRPEL